MLCRFSLTSDEAWVAREMVVVTAFWHGLQLKAIKIQK